MFIYQIPKLQIDNDVSKFLPKEHPAVLSENKINEEFGKERMILLIMHFKNSFAFCQNFCINSFKCLGVQLISIFSSETNPQ